VKKAGPIPELLGLAVAQKNMSIWQAGILPKKYIKRLAMGLPLCIINAGGDDSPPDRYFSIR
jgi:hypothetical protein